MTASVAFGMPSILYFYGVSRRQFEFVFGLYSDFGSQL